MDQTASIKSIFGFLIGILLIIAGLSGRPGSMLAAVITTESLDDTSAENDSSSSSTDFSAISVGSNEVVNYIQLIFGPYAGQALQVAKCESNYDAKAYNSQAVLNSHASGVFQILYHATWSTTSFKNRSPMDYKANIEAAYEIFRRDGFSWRQWQCKPGVAM